MHHSTFGATLVVMGFLSVVQAQQPAAGRVIRLTVGGTAREALVFAPTMAAPSGRAPLILAFHGHGGAMRGFANVMRLQRVWPQAVVVYPQGLPTETTIDPDGLKPGWDTGDDAATKPDDRDLAFVDALMAQLHRQFTIDDDRVYATGFSNGAFFSLLLWATRADRFAAVAAVAGLIREWHPTQPRPVLYIGGTRDPLVTPDKQHDTIAKVRAFDGATGPGEACGAGCTFYASTTRTPVRVVTHPGGHEVPGFAPAAIVAFFKNHTR